jgi:hypothetical protein
MGKCKRSPSRDWKTFLGKCKRSPSRDWKTFLVKQMQGHHDARMPITGPTTAETLSTI